MNKRNRIAVLFDDNEYKQLLQLAGLVPLSSWIRSQLFPVDDAQRAKELIPLLKKSIERSNKLIPRGEELATGEASARSNDAPAERRLPKSAVDRGYVDVRPKAQKSIPAELPAAPVDMRKFLP